MTCARGLCCLLAVSVLFVGGLHLLLQAAIIPALCGGLCWWASGWIHAYVWWKGGRA